MDEVIVAGIDRGLTLDGALQMDLGALLDYCITWNEVHGLKQTDDKPKVRDATQADIDAFLG